jgi:hypothetical protein
MSVSCPELTNLSIFASEILASFRVFSWANGLLSFWNLAAELLTHETHETTRKEEPTELIFASEILAFFRVFRGQMDSSASEI